MKNFIVIFLLSAYLVGCNDEAGASGVGGVPSNPRFVTVTTTGTASLNDLNVTTNIDTATLNATGILDAAKVEIGVGADSNSWSANYSVLRVDDLSALWGSVSQTYLSHNLTRDASWQYIKTDEASTLLFNADGSLSYYGATSGTAGATASVSGWWRSDVNGLFSIGHTLTSNIARLEIEDGAMSTGIVTKITQDDQNVAGLIIGNDSWSTTDINGLELSVSNAGVSEITAVGATASTMTIGTNTVTDAIGIANNGTISAGKACAAGYTRMGTNYCLRDARSGASGSLTRDACTALAVPSSDAVKVVVKGVIDAKSNNAVGARTTQFNGYTDSGCTTWADQADAIAYEASAVAAGTVLERYRYDMTVPNVSGNIYVKQTDDASDQGNIQYLIIGYWD